MNNQPSVVTLEKIKNDSETHASMSFFQKCVYFLFSVFLLLTCNSIYWVAVNTRSRNLIIFMLFFLLVVILLNAIVAILQNRMDLSYFVYFSFLWLILVVPFSLINAAWGFFHVRQFLLFILFPLLTGFFINFLIQKGLFSSFINLIIKIITSVACLSMCMWLFALMSNHWTGSIVIDWGQIQYTPSLLGIQFQTQSINFLGMNILRNTSFFAEAPMYSFILTMGILLKLFIIDKKVKLDFQNIVLVVTVISTFSSTGIIVGLVAYVASYVTDKKSRASLVLTLIVPAVAFFIYWMLNLKTQHDTYNSVSTRLEDLQIGFQAWKSKPFIGNGLNNSSVLIGLMDYNRTMMGGNSGFSSGLFDVLAGGGFYQFAFTFLIPLLTNIWSKDTRGWLFYLFFIVLMIFTMVDSSFFFFFIVVIAYFLPTMHIQRIINEVG